MNRLSSEILEFISRPDHTYTRLNGDYELFKSHFGEKDFRDFSTKFQLDFEVGKEYREEIDDISELEQTDQVIETLHYIRDCIYNKEDYSKAQILDFKYLVKKLLYHKWTMAGQEHYDILCEYLEKWQDYFLSYSRNNNPKASMSPEDINKEYRSFIEETLSTDERKDDFWDKENLVVKGIVKLLKKANLIGFVDYENIKYGDEFAEEIFNITEECFTFLQVFHSSILHKSIAPIENWPFLEFRKFSELGDKIFGKGYFDNAASRKRKFFILLASDVQEVIPEAGYNRRYRKWLKEIQKTHNVLLDPKADHDVLKRSIKDLAYDINAFKVSLINSIKTDY